ncbi:porin family protein [Flavobacterium sp. ZT3P35]|uniref:porin family protein n=1 Tax=Flavobacterium sp. ZT3P35 TaxID=3401727 RepID=UPI003AADC085
MKKIILTVAAVFAFGFANAQETKFGVKGGLNLATFSGDTDGLDLKSKAGLNVGGFVEVKLSDKLALQPELLFSMQGTNIDEFEFSDGNQTFVVDASIKMSYINVPIMLKYYAAEKFNLEVGPQVGFLLSAKTVAKANGNEAEDDVKDSFESVDFGLNFGLGYDFTKNIAAGARYNVGLANIGKTEPGDDSKITNSVFSLSLAYKF